MKKLSVFFFSFFSVILITLSLIIILTTHNLSSRELDGNNTIKNDYTNIKNSIEERKTRLIYLIDEQSYLNRNLASIEASQDELKHISNYGLDTLNVDIFDSYIISTFNTKFDLSSKYLMAQQKNQYEKLNNYYFENNSNPVDISDFLIMQILNDLYFQDSVNSLVIDYNMEVSKIKGMYEYYKYRHNYLLKSKILDSLVNDKSRLDLNTHFKELREKGAPLVELKKLVRDYYREVLTPTQDNMTYLENTSSHIMNERNAINPGKGEGEPVDNFNYYNFNSNLALNLEILNRYVNYLDNYNIQDEILNIDNPLKKVRRLRNGSKNIIIIEELTQNGDVILSYFNLNGNLLFKVNTVTSEVLYAKGWFDDDTDEEVLKSKELYMN